MSLLGDKLLNSAYKAALNDRDSGIAASAPSAGIISRNPDINEDDVDETVTFRSLRTRGPDQQMTDGQAERGVGQSDLQGGADHRGEGGSDEFPNDNVLLSKTGDDHHGEGWRSPEDELGGNRRSPSDFNTYLPREDDFRMTTPKPLENVTYRRRGMTGLSDPFSISPLSTGLERHEVSLERELRDQENYPVSGTRRGRRFASSSPPRVRFQPNHTPSALAYAGRERWTSTPRDPGMTLTANDTDATSPRGYQAQQHPIQIPGNLPNVMAPPPYDGTSDVDTWINRFIAFAKIKGWSVEEQAAAAPCFFRATAAAWFDCLEPNTVNSRDRLFEELVKRFGYHSSEKWSQIENWDKRNQGTEEGVDDYVMAIKKIGKTLDKSAGEVRDKVIRGFRPHISEYVMEKEPSTLEEAIALAKKANSIMKRRNNVDTQQISSLSAQISALRTSLGSDMSMVKEQVMAVSVQAEDLKKKMTEPERPPTTRPPYNPPRPSVIHPTNRPVNAGQGPKSGYGYRSMECFRCGNPSHTQDQCFHINRQCYECMQIGHLGRMCPQRLKRSSNNRQ